MSIAAPSSEIAPPPSRRPGRLLLVAGVVSRTWLWFVAGLVAITLVPILFGWRPFVVQSGSMEPRIRVGDVVLASPVDSTDQLVGRVTVFDDPDRPGTYKTHRVINSNADGTLVTQGDANPTPDTSTITLDEVQGLGRLLVQFAGLPLIWVRTGQWLLLLLFLASLALAAYVVNRDQEEDEEAEGGDGGDGGDVVDLPRPSGSSGSTAVAASTPMDKGLRRTSRPVRALLLLLVGSLGLGMPTSAAAFSATSKNSGNTWATGNWDYTSTVTGLSPWLYWKLDETSGTVAADSSGNNRTATYYTGNKASATGFTRGITGALESDTPNLGVTLSGGTACINTTSTTAMNAPTQITEVVWFKTTTTQGGKLFGFEMPRTGVAVAGSGGTYDRHLYMDGSGKVWYGVYNGGYFTVGSTDTLNDGAWHMAVGQMGTGGMKLWIDGVLQGTNANAAGETTTGWFRAGCGNLAGWGGSWDGGNSPTTNSGTTQNRPFAGSLDEISVWQSVLTPAQIASLWAAH